MYPRSATRTIALSILDRVVDEVGYTRVPSSNNSGTLSGLLLASGLLSAKAPTGLNQYKPRSNRV